MARLHYHVSNDMTACIPLSSLTNANFATVHQRVHSFLENSVEVTLYLHLHSIYHAVFLRP